MSMEEEIVYDGEFILKDENSLVEVRELIENGSDDVYEYTAKYLSPILDSKYYFDVDYLFDYDKVLKITQGYHSEWYLSNNNRRIMWCSLSNNEVDVEEDGTFNGILQLTVREEGEFYLNLLDFEKNVVMFYFGTKDEKFLCQVLRELLSCIVRINENVIKRHIDNTSEKIQELLNNKEKLISILHESKNS